MDSRPFSVQIPQAILDDLFERLARVRWPDEAEGAGWEYGTNLAFMKELVDYWRTQFNWREQEQAMNVFAHYRALVNGLQIHFIHERGKGPHPLPLILTHGWPSTFCEMLKILPMLSDPASYGGDPADAFDVVVPSLPGYGFSDVIPRYSLWETHDFWAELMVGLGYERFGAQGGRCRCGRDHQPWSLFPRPSGRHSPQF